MIATLAAPVSPPSQREAIRRATVKSVRARNLYAEQVVNDIAAGLAQAEEAVKKSILNYATLGSLPDNKLARLEGLKKLDAEIAEAMKALQRDQTLLFRRTTKAAFRQGIYGGIGEFADAQLPFYKDLTPEGIDKLSTRVFTLVDTDALDFMANYNLVLAGDVHRELAVKVGEPLMEDVFYDDILAGVKTVNKHASDKTYNEATLKKMLGHMDALKKLAKSTDTDVKDMAEGYIAWIEKVQKARKDGTPTEGLLTTYVRKQAPAKKKVQDAPFTVRHTKILMPKREIRSGEIVASDESLGNSSLFRGRKMRDGEQYEVTFPDGTRAVYRPWSSKNLYAQQGEFELILSDAPTPAELEKAMGHMEALGLKANVATPEDAELLYLHKQAYVTKTDSTDPAYKRMVEDLDARSASKDERIRAMRGFWEKKLGVSDLTKVPGYDPMGQYQRASKDPSKDGGYRFQYRFDISEAELERQMKGYGLQHGLTNGDDIPTFIDRVLGSNGTMVSTIEKLRAGVPVAGMSPESDMGTGGASYFFTRIRKLPTEGGEKERGLYFKKQLLRRMDAISYGGDHFGKVTDNFVTENRGSTPSEWKSFARRCGNETILKNSVTILDNIEEIAVGGEWEKKALLEVFKKRGITKLPDGRAVKDIIVVV